MDNIHDKILYILVAIILGLTSWTLYSTNQLTIDVAVLSDKILSRNFVGLQESVNSLRLEIELVKRDVASIKNIVKPSVGSGP